MSRLIPKIDKFSSIFKGFAADYDVHFCGLEEIDDVVRFLDEYWQKGHALVKSRALLDWQHLDREQGRYNFVLARHKATGAIHALLGFIPNTFFDPAIEKMLVWGAIWKTRDDAAPAGLGTYLFQFITNELPVETWVGFGLSDDSKKNTKLMGFTLCSADTYFFANPAIKEFRIASGIEPYQTQGQQDEPGYTLGELTDAGYADIPADGTLFAHAAPYKSKAYYEKRFLRHPFYRYRCYAIRQGGEEQALFFARECSANGSSCLRLVDYVGDYALLKTVRGSMSALLAAKRYEFIDIITSNADDDVMKAAGFINKDSDSGVIIPNYFEPFVRQNVPMDYTYISLREHYTCVISKGDADQDRPSIL